MRKKKAQAHSEEHESGERWLITYADMITLLMAFFIMMYGMSLLDAKKFAEFKAGMANDSGKNPAISGGQGLLSAGSGIVGDIAPALGPGSGDQGGNGDNVSGEVTRDQLGKLVGEIDRRLQSAGARGSVDLAVDPRGLVVYVTDRVFFDLGSANITSQGVVLLDQLSLVLGHIDNSIVIEGHTDDLPIHTREFPSNWELSTARATQVLRYLLETRRLPAPRFSAAGYADTRPRVSNDSLEHRAMNRRVEIVILTPSQEKVDGKA